MLFLCPILAAVVATFAWICNAQVAVQSGMTADAHCGNGYCVTAVYTPTDKMVNYTLVVAQRTGWWSIAQGTGMVDAKMAIGWVSSDNNGASVVLSYRCASDYSEPQPGSADPATHFSINADVSGVRDDGGTTVYSWMMALPNADDEEDDHSDVQHVFAASVYAPKTNNPNATINKHTRTETGLSFNLTKAYDGATPTGLFSVSKGQHRNSSAPLRLPSSYPVFNRTASFGDSNANHTTSNAPPSTSDGMPGDTRLVRDLSVLSTRLFLAHVIIMLLAWMVCLPIGMIIARYGRISFLWFPIHRAVQMFGAALVLSGLALSTSAVQSRDGSSGHFGSTHGKLGLGLVLLLFIQTVLGILAHALRRALHVRILRHLHRPFGVLLIALAVWGVRQGFREWEWRAPRYAMAIVYVWISLLAAVYFLGLLRCRRERREEREKKARQQAHQLAQRQELLEEEQRLAAVEQRWHETAKGEW